MTFKNCVVEESRRYLDIVPDETQYRLSDFTFENIRGRTQDLFGDESCIEDVKVIRVEVEEVQG